MILFPKIEWFYSLKPKDLVSKIKWPYSPKDILLPKIQIYSKFLNAKWLKSKEKEISFNYIHLLPFMSFSKSHSVRIDLMKNRDLL